MYAAMLPALVVALWLAWDNARAEKYRRRQRWLCRRGL